MNSADRPSPFDRMQAAQKARTMSRDELELSIHVVCSAFSPRWFPGIKSLNDVREMVEVLAHESRRREVLEAIAQTEVPFTCLRSTQK